MTRSKEYEKKGSSLVPCSQSQATLQEQPPRLLDRSSSIAERDRANKTAPGSQTVP